MPRRRLWLAAVVLLLLAAGLLSLVEASSEPPRRPVSFPTHMREAEWKRHEARQTLPPPLAVTPRPGRPAIEPAPKRDPFVLALPVRPDEPVMVFEANALRHSRLGELFISCALAENPRTFSDFQKETGVDPLKDIDRVGFVGRAMVVSGYFDRARWERLVEEGRATVEAYGEAGRLYRQLDGSEVVGVWKNQLLVLGPDDAAARQAMDQLEGRSAPPESAVPEDLAYGEVYGVIPGATVQRLFSAQDQALGAKLAAAASRVELHVDAMQDVAAVVRVDGKDDQALGDLARTLGGALAAGRLSAKAGGDQPLTELLDAARVVNEQGRFSLELALPAATLERWFEDCAGRKEAGQRAGAPAPRPERAP